MRSVRNPNYIRYKSTRNPLQNEITKSTINQISKTKRSEHGIGGKRGGAEGAKTRSRAAMSEAEARPLQRSRAEIQLTSGREKREGHTYETKGQASSFSLSVSLSLTLASFESLPCCVLRCCVLCVVCCVLCVVCCVLCVVCC